MFKASLNHVVRSYLKKRKKSYIYVKSFFRELEAVKRDKKFKNRFLQGKTIAATESGSAMLERCYEKRAQLKGDPGAARPEVEVSQRHSGIGGDPAEPCGGKRCFRKMPDHQTAGVDDPQDKSESSGLGLRTGTSERQTPRPRWTSAG